MTWTENLLRKAKRLRPSRTLFPAGHFYSPYPDLGEIERRRDAVFDRSPRRIPGIDLREDEQLRLLGELSTRFYEEFPYPEDGLGARFDLGNPAFPPGDAVLLYSVLRHVEPRRVIEIGSGHSSALMLDVNERFLGGRVDFTFIEPFPDLLRHLARPGDLEGGALLAQPLHSVDPGLFEKLEPGDILFIDSTHVSKAGSDVNQIFFEILPALTSGTYIHLHDIFYPFEYPEEWVLETRAWNEDYLLRAFLLNNPNYEIVLFNDFLRIHHRGELESLMPVAARNSGGSLWLRKIRAG